jgi:hypothetical protein
MGPPCSAVFVYALQSGPACRAWQSFALSRPSAGFLLRLSGARLESWLCAPTARPLWCVLAKLYKTFASSQIGSPFPVYNSLQLLLSLPRTSISLSQDSTLYIEHYSGRLGRLSVLVAVTQVYPISYSTLHIPRQLDNKQSRRIVDIKPICNSTVTELELAEWTGQQHLWPKISKTNIVSSVSLFIFLLLLLFFGEIYFIVHVQLYI